MTAMELRGKGTVLPLDGGCDCRGRSPHAKLRKVSATVTTLRRGARNTANHRTGRYPPYQWFNHVDALCASKDGGRNPAVLFQL